VRSDLPDPAVPVINMDSINNCQEQLVNMFVYLLSLLLRIYTQTKILCMHTCNSVSLWEIFNDNHIHHIHHINTAIW
jgi:hypothetical protein